MLQIIFLVLTWLTGFIAMITFIGTLYLWANGRRMLRVNLLTILLFLISFGGLVLFS